MVEYQKPRIGVVVVNFNSGTFLQTCVRSIQKSDIPVDIVIVDNYSSDGSLEFLDSSIADSKQRSGPPDVIKNKNNVGFSKAVNQGASKLDNEYIMLLNPDSSVFPRTFSKLQDIMSADAEISIAGPLVFNQDGTEQRGCRRNEPTLKRSIITSFGLSKRFQGVDQTFDRLPSDLREVDAVSGAAMMIRRTHFEQLGGMDESYFLHCEDLDICRRARDGGGKVMCCPNVSVMHHQGASSGVSTITVEKHKHQGMLTYHRTHAGKNLPKSSLLLVELLIQGHCYVTVMKQLLAKGLNLIGIKNGIQKNDTKSFSTLDIVENKKPVVVITGVRSDVGDYLVKHLANSQFQCIAVIRNQSAIASKLKNIRWLNLQFFMKSPADDFGPIDVWINLAPIWTTRMLIKAFRKFSPKKIIAISSSSIEGKADSEDVGEIEVVEKLLDGERWLEKYAQDNGISASILRPTLIYGGPRNNNVNFIEKVVRYARVFPLIGKGDAKRQPIHAEDVAIACKLLIRKGVDGFNTYTIGGGEVLTYRDMVGRSFRKLGLKERFIQVPEKLVKATIKACGWVPGLRFLNPEMVGRMNQDLVYSNKVAERELLFRPRKFKP